MYAPKWGIVTSMMHGAFLFTRGSFSHKEHQNGLKSVFTRRRRRFLKSGVPSIQETKRSPPPGAAWVLWVVWSCLLCAFVKCAGATHARGTPDIRCHWVSCQISISPSHSRVHLFIDIEQALSAAIPAKHSSPRAFRVCGSVVDAPHGNSSRVHLLALLLQ